MSETLPVTEKLARLVREKGWTPRHLAQAAKIDPRTAAALCAGSKKKARNDIVKAAANALGLTVDELHHVELPVLLRRVREAESAAAPVERLRQRQPALADWLENTPQHDLTPLEIEELASLQGTGGPLTAAGLEEWMERLRRKRQLLRRTEILAGTSYLPLLEEITRLMLAELDPSRQQAQSAQE